MIQHVLLWRASFIWGSTMLQHVPALKLFFIAEWCSIVWVYQTYLSIHQMMDIWVASNLLVLLNSAPVAIGIQISFWDPAFNSFGSIYGCGLPDHTIVLFLIFWGTTKVFHSSRTILHSFQQCMCVPIFPHPCQHVIFLKKKKFL